MRFSHFLARIFFEGPWFSALGEGIGFWTLGEGHPPPIPPPSPMCANGAKLRFWACKAKLFSSFSSFYDSYTGQNDVCMVWLRPDEGLDIDSTAAVDNVVMPTGTPQAGNDLQVVGWRVAEVRTEWSLIENTCFGINTVYVHLFQGDTFVAYDKLRYGTAAVHPVRENCASFDTKLSIKTIQIYVFLYTC